VRAPKRGSKERGRLGGIRTISALQRVGVAQINRISTKPVRQPIENSALPSVGIVEITARHRGLYSIMQSAGAAKQVAMKTGCSTDASEMAEAYCLGRLSLEDQTAFEDHYLVCPPCAELVVQAQEFIDSLVVVLSQRAENNHPCAQMPA
jgi:adenine-specific DNA methylase